MGEWQPGSQAGRLGLVQGTARSITQGLVGELVEWIWGGQRGGMQGPRARSQMSLYAKPGDLNVVLRVEELLLVLVRVTSSE